MAGLILLAMVVAAIATWTLRGVVNDASRPPIMPAVLVYAFILVTTESGLLLAVWLARDWDVCCRDKMKKKTAYYIDDNYTQA